MRRLAAGARAGRLVRAARAFSSAGPSAPLSIPSQARVVVAGGGIIGTSVAYHLAKLGWDDVLLLERDQLTSGTTWHAAGLVVTFGSLSETSTEMRKHSKDLYSRVLEEETGMSTGFMPVGFVELATDEGYLEEYRRVAAHNRKCGVDVHEISAAEVKSLFPLLRTDDVLAGFYVEDDGRVNPVDATAAMARGARNRGVRIVEGVSITGVRAVNGRVCGVRTSAGDVACEYVVNAAGMWARQLAELSGVAVPNQAAEHYYLLTEPMAEVGREWPVVEDPSSHVYIRPEGGGLLVGLFEPDAAAWRVPKIPTDFSFGEIEPDWDRLAPFLEKAMARVPSSLDVGAKKLFCGPESFTPDLSPIVGEVPELRNYYVAAGMNSIGILTGGGIGRLVAQTIVDGEPDMDVTAMLPARLQPYQATQAYRAARVIESLGKVYKCHYPNRPTQTARGAKLSPLHSRLAERGAYMREVSGWEAADWYAGAGVTPEIGELTWARPPWFGQWAAEHAACRTGVVLIDMSFMSKFLVQGDDAGRLLDRLATAKVDGPAGTISYTQLLSPSGTLQADLTITKLCDRAPIGAGAGLARGDGTNGFLVVATDTAHRHVEMLLRRAAEEYGGVVETDSESSGDGSGGGGNGGGGRGRGVGVGGGASAVVTDVTGALAQINLQGPRSREVLGQLTSVDVSDAAFPFRAARPIDIGCARLLATRITYVGELGYELFVPVESAIHVYDEIVRVGEPMGLVHAGLKALGSLRMEKGYRDYGHDLDNLDTLMEAGLGFTADFEKRDGFVGMERTLEQKASGPPARRLVQVLLHDPQPLMHHGEIVYRNGEIVGEVRSASYGHSLGGAVGLSMVERTDGEGVTAAWIREGAWEVDVAGVRYPAKASLRPLYDPRNERIKL